MSSLRSFVRNLIRMASALLARFIHVWRFLVLCLRPAPALAADNFFLHKQLAQYQERQVKSRRASDAMRVALVWLSHFFDWRTAFVIVQPATLIRWHRKGFRLMWCWQTRPGRPVLPRELRALIHRMAQENPTWGQKRIANERLLKQRTSWVS